MGATSTRSRSGPSRAGAPRRVHDTQLLPFRAHEPDFRYLDRSLILDSLAMDVSFTRRLNASRGDVR